MCGIFYFAFESVKSIRCEVVAVIVMDVVLEKRLDEFSRTMAGFRNRGL